MKEEQIILESALDESIPRFTRFTGHAIYDTQFANETPFTRVHRPTLVSDRDDSASDSFLFAANVPKISP